MRLKTVLYVFINIIILYRLVNSKELIEDNTDEILEGVKSIYRLDYNRSYEIFLENFETHPLSPFGLIAVEWLKNQQIESMKRANDKLEQDIKRVASYYKEKLENNREDYYSLFYYGLTLGLKARLSLAKKDWLGILINGYKSVKYMKRAIDNIKDDYDVYLPVGLFSYYVGISSSYMKIASYILDIAGSKEEGLEYMKLTADSGKYGKYEAQGVLAFVYLYIEGNYNESLKYSRLLSEEFDENPYYKYLMAEAYLEIGQLDKVIELTKGIEKYLPDLNNRVKRENEFRYNLLKGSIYLYTNQLYDSEKFLTKCLNFDDFDLNYELGNLYLRLGFLYDMLGKRTNAKFWYRKAIESDNRSITVKRAKYYLNTPFNLEKNGG